ncbi:MAG: PASTA domain-containing protein [Clostridia bacterium]|nr:PASTA domain-containing protein [Clostridia bacterium]
MAKAKRVSGKLNKAMLRRSMCVLLVLIFLTAGVTGGRLFYLMVVKGDELQAEASDQLLYDTTLAAPRGNIYDSNMKVLATSATCWTVYISPNNFKNIKDSSKLEAVKAIIAEKLSEILDLEYDDVYAMTEKTDSYYVTVKRKVEKPEADAVREFIANFSEYELSTYIGLDESTKRYYPNDNLASAVLGFVGDDNQGLAGIESFYDSELTGVPGRVVAAKNAQGADMPFSYEKVISAQAGSSLVLTVDSYIQHVTEKYLEAAVIENKVANRGVAIVMNVNTGAILSMAVLGDFDPNEPFTLSESDNALLEGLEGDERSKKLAELRNKQWRNKAVSDSYEPGSVFKIITAAAALEENLTSRHSSYNCPGYIVIAGHRYDCHKKIGHGTQTLEQAISNSCNPAFITLGTRLGADLFSKYFEAFGLTEKTGIDLPGEVSSLYYTADKMGPVELSSASFGQTFTITPIQLITAISAAVNGGYLVEPYVVSQILDADGNIKKTTSTTVKRQVISAETSKLLCEMLETVVDGGGGKNAYVPGYRIGGKTGTSQKMVEINMTGKDNLYVASFCGIAPINDPEVAVLVLLDEPMGSSYYGGTVSAPVGGQILADILPYLGYEPQYSEEELANLSVSVPSVIDSTIASAKQKLTTVGMSYKIIGNGDTVIKQVPAAGQSVSTGSKIVLYTDNTEPAKVEVPDLSGMTPSVVNSSAASAGINVEFSGNTIAGSSVISYKQSVAPGTKVDAGTVITVYFRDNTAVDFAAAG